jgi:AraC family transcriptional regulator
MGEGGDPGKVLRGGQFYSPLQASLRNDDVLLSELRQPCARQIPRHEHELAYVTVVLSGDYLEGDRGKLAELRPFTAAFNPSGIAHSTLIGPAGASLFTIELRQEYVRRWGANLPAQTTFDRGAGAMLWPGLHLYSAFKDQTADALLLESYGLEILGAISGFEAAERSAPLWFRRVKDRLHEEFREDLRMCALAREAGVHPVHLARTFRAYEKQTPGTYLQRLRVRAACQMLREADYPLAIVATDCGFADQSHFTRVFKKITQTTPAKFRLSLAPLAGV